MKFHVCVTTYKKDNWEEGIVVRGENLEISSLPFDFVKEVGIEDDGTRHCRDNIGAVEASSPEEAFVKARRLLIKFREKKKDIA